MTILPLLLAPAAQAPETPRQFVERLYSSYRHEGFSPLDKPARFFSPDLVAAIRKDSAGGRSAISTAIRCATARTTKA